MNTFLPRTAAGWLLLLILLAIVGVAGASAYKGEHKHEQTNQRVDCLGYSLEHDTPSDMC